MAVHALPYFGQGAMRRLGALHSHLNVVVAGKAEFPHGDLKHFRSVGCMDIMALPATIANGLVNHPCPLYSISENHMAVQTYGGRFLMQQFRIIGSMSGVACQAASGNDWLMFQLALHHRFMALQAQGSGGFRPKMGIGFSAMGIVTFQTAFFSYWLMGIGAPFDPVAEEAEIVALSGHPESALKRIFIIMAPYTSSRL